MGYGYTEKTQLLIKEKKDKEVELIALGIQVKILKQHPAYVDLIPQIGESLVGFTLRYAANLVSPPQQEGESYDVECVVIKAGILSLEKEITEIYYEYNKHLLK